MMSSSFGGRSGFSRTGANGVSFQNGVGRSLRNFPPEKAERLSPFRIAPHRTRTNRSAHPAPCPAPAPATCTPPCPVACRDSSEVLLTAAVGIAETSTPGAMQELTLPRPKSRILACPRSVTKMLAGLMSRWTIPLAWAASRASAISIAKCEQSFQFHRPPRMRCFSVMPSRNSMAMKACPFSSPIS